MLSSIAPVYRLNAARIAKQIIQGIPAGLVISLNAWATILINSQPRWLFRKRRWSEGEMRAISCYYLVVAYLMLRVVRLTSTLTKRPGRPYGDFFRNTRPILGQVAIFSLATMLMDEFTMFYILRKFGLEKKRILITGRALDKDMEAVSDDDCCICYGAMLGDDDDDQEAYMGRQGDGMSKDTDHVLENFCVVKQHVAHRGCIRKWYNYGPKGYRPMEAFRIFRWGTTLHSAVAGMHSPMGGRVGLGWLLSLHTREPQVQLRIPLEPAHDVQLTRDATTTSTDDTQLSPTNQGTEPLQVRHVHVDEEVNQQEAIAAETAEPVLRPLFPQQDEYTIARNAGRKTCPACRQQLVLNFVDLAKGRLEMSYVQKFQELVRDMTKFSDWRGLILRSLITAGWVGVTIVGGKLRIVAMDKALAKHQRNRVLATVSTMST
ncbi:hypothetical protein CPC16_007607 [Podila verticillata]|nr:hypothetical protein BGZ52_009806 [Haplosporangium bisporale]KAF9386261.1 hypothetical protein CPC16_007607 [Podila verticillata]KFH69670.1 hypothetical protein MVEG_04476 [Podila verticillata NRRL 6337]